MLSHGADQLRAFPILEPSLLSHGAEDLVGLRLDAAHVAKARASLRDVDGAKIARPVVDIEKQRLVDMLQVGQIVGGKRKIDLAGGNLGEITLGLRKQRIVLDAQPVTQYVRLRVAVRTWPVPYLSKVKLVCDRSAGRLHAKAACALTQLA